MGSRASLGGDPVGGQGQRIGERGGQFFCRLGFSRRTFGIRRRQIQLRQFRKERQVFDFGFRLRDPVGWDCRHLLLVGRLRFDRGIVRRVGARIIRGSWLSAGGLFRHLNPRIHLGEVVRQLLRLPADHPERGFGVEDQRENDVANQRGGIKHVIIVGPTQAHEARQGAARAVSGPVIGDDAGQLLHLMLGKLAGVGPEPPPASQQRALGRCLEIKPCQVLGGAVDIGQPRRWRVRLDLAGLGLDRTERWRPDRDRLLSL